MRLSCNLLREVYLDGQLQRIKVTKIGIREMDMLFSRISQGAREKNGYEMSSRLGSIRFLAYALVAHSTMRSVEGLELEVHIIG